jgi:hypothetical protein
MLYFAAMSMALASSILCVASICDARAVSLRLSAAASNVTFSAVNTPWKPSEANLSGSMAPNRPNSRLRTAGSVIIARAASAADFCRSAGIVRMPVRKSSSMLSLGKGFDGSAATTAIEYFSA